jgi:hypothetical protein
MLGGRSGLRFDRFVAIEYLGLLFWNFGASLPLLPQGSEGVRFNAAKEAAFASTIVLSVFI